MGNTARCLLKLCALAAASTSQNPKAFEVLPPLPFGAGRTPSAPDQILSPQPDALATIQKPQSVSECRLIICQITDVYTLENLASFKAMVDDIRLKAPDATVVSVLTGDFLSPYLLSSVDQGVGMMNALNRIGLDYLTWGNHEADIDHENVCNHVRNFKGKAWINSNMLNHDAMDHQKEYDVIELTAPDGSQERKVGLCAVLSDDPDLYSHFPAPGAFGGAHISDPWEALKKYKDILENQEGCNLVVPLQHLYVPDDHKTCRDFDFPLILSGHDHHCVDEIVEGTRLIKPGMNAVYASVVEVCWEERNCQRPKIRSRFTRCSDWESDTQIEEENERAYDALLPLRNTELASVPSQFEPLSSGSARGEVSSMGKYICSLIKAALNNDDNQRTDAVLLMGGNIRGNVDEYPKGSFFSLETLQHEIKADETLAVVRMPGWLLSKGVESTHSGDPIPGWFQYDDGIRQDGKAEGVLRVTHVNDQPIVPSRVYRVATKISDLTNGQCPPFVQYYTTTPEALPQKGSYFNVQSQLMTYFARNLWRRLWDAMTDELSVRLPDDDELECPIDSCPAERLSILDTTGNGELSVEEIQQALQKHLDLSIDKSETSLAEMVHTVADHNGNGKVTVADFEHYCDRMSVSLLEQWLSSYDKASKAFEKATKEIFEQVEKDVKETVEIFEQVEKEAKK